MRGKEEEEGRRLGLGCSERVAFVDVNRVMVLFGVSRVGEVYGGAIIMHSARRSLGWLGTNL